MSCILRVFGDNFQVDEFVNLSEWKNLDSRKIKIFRKGELITRNSNRVVKASGFNVEVSNTDFKDFDKQQQDCIEFIKTYQKAFELFTNYNADWVCLDFGLETRFQNGFSKTYSLIPEFMQLCGTYNINVWMSNYLTKNDKRKQNRMRKKFWRSKKQI